jgi:glucose-6-phosphate 1-dehydrogenase
VDQGTLEDYKRLSTRIETLEREKKLPSNRLFYFALPPAIVPSTINNMGEVGLNKSSGWTRIIMEKPFGRDLNSAFELNRLVHKYFDESQIYRIDHFLGKETVQNLLVFRFANAFFERLWNRDSIESVEITVAENIGIEERGQYYEQTGALRDMVENHLTQLLTLIAIEIPVAFEADAIHDEKAKVLRQIMPILPENVIYGQYTSGKIDGEEVLGYKDEKDVLKNSQTETYVALKLEVANWRWKGVPFYLKTGKRMPSKLTQIQINFHCAPTSIFRPYESTCPVESNQLVITLQPEEGFHIQFHIKSIGQPITLTTQRLHFHYSKVFGTLPEAYETLILDAIKGDQTLFVRSEEVELAWRLYNPVLEMKIPIKNYTSGTWGPDLANKF